MNEKRLAVVKHAWQFLDSTGAKRVSFGQLNKAYNAAEHPRVRTREKKAETVAAEFEQCMGARSQGGNITE